MKMSERQTAMQAIAKLLDVAGVEVPIEEILSKLNLRELRGLRYRVERAMKESYDEGLQRGHCCGQTDPDNRGAP